VREFHSTSPAAAARGHSDAFVIKDQARNYCLFVSQSQRSAGSGNILNLWCRYGKYLFFAFFAGDYFTQSRKERIFNAVALEQNSGTRQAF